MRDIYFRGAVLMSEFYSEVLLRNGVFAVFAVSLGAYRGLHEEVAQLFSGALSETFRPARRLFSKAHMGLEVGNATLLDMLGAIGGVIRQIAVASPTAFLLVLDHKTFTSVRPTMYMCFYDVYTA